MEAYPSALLLIAFVAMLAPLLAELPSNFRLPVVVLEVIMGILIGPHVFSLASPDGMVGTLGELGLTFLLFMVGLEIDFDKIRGRPLSLAVGGWFLSFFIAMICMFFFNVIGLIQTPPVLAAPCDPPDRPDPLPLLWPLRERPEEPEPLPPFEEPREREEPLEDSVAMVSLQLTSADVTLDDCLERVRGERLRDVDRKSVV